jgi:hypothetical protein
MRDLLPDLLHERLDVSLRAAVVAHVDDCEDCRAELQLLRDTRGMLARQTPRIDVHYVVGALPLAPKRVASPARAPLAVARNRRWADWRVAAAVAVLAVGGTSVAVLQRTTGASPAIERVADTSAPAAPRAATPVASTSEPAGGGAPVATSAPTSESTTPARESATTTRAVASADEGIGMTGRLSDMNERQLRALLDDIDNMQAVPITEPDPVSLKVESTHSSSSSTPEEEL